MQLTSQQLFAMSPILPVIDIENAECAIPVAEALRAGGIGVLEIVLRSSDSLEAIKRIRRALPDILVGAGTVTSVDTLNAALDAGSQFIITPGLTSSLAQVGQGLPVPFIPGVSNAGNIMLGLEHGLSAFKFFPAEAAGGIATLRALTAPFGEIEFCPTGGINEDNLVTYLSLRGVNCVGGSWLAPKAIQQKQAFIEIETSARQAMRLASGALSRL